MRLGVFLPPGAARAAYQVGAVQALVREGGLHFDVVAASSVGSLNGAFVATGQVDRLAELWAGWRTRHILGVDWRALARGLVWWAPNLMHNRPQKERVIDPYLGEAGLLPSVRFRFNLADLTEGECEIFEWPGAPIALAEGVNASVAVPGAIRPVEALGRQWADGLTIDGFPVEALALATGIERLFVLGVAPRTPDRRRAHTAYGVLLRALEINQYSETQLGLERAEAVNGEIRRWRADVGAALEALERLPDAALREDLVGNAERIAREAGFPYERGPVEIVPVLPERPTRMFFTSYSPRRSRALLEAGRRDALGVLAALDRGGG
jgi:predicted acylesterase/phospholipase RssA